MKDLPTYFATLAAAVLAVENHIAAREIVLVEPMSFSNAFEFDGVRYGEMKQAHAEIATVKGKTTRKWAHLTIFRMESGSYEVVFYVL